jgi:hypothetical protein
MLLGHGSEQKSAIGLSFRRPSEIFAFVGQVMVVMTRRYWVAPDRP